MAKTHPYPFFTRQSERDTYLDRLIANGHRVRAQTVRLATDTDGEPMYTVVDIDKRKGN